MCDEGAHNALADLLRRTAIGGVPVLRDESWCALCAQSLECDVANVPLGFAHKQQAWKCILHNSLSLSHTVLANAQLSTILRSIYADGLYSLDHAQCAKRRQYAKQRNGSQLNAMCDVTSRIIGA